MAQLSSRTTAVVGGGVIGMSIAFELASRGVACTVVDPAPGRGATWAAAGMLSPAAEVAPGEEPLLDELRRSAQLWPSFATRIRAASGVDVDYAASGSILLGLSASDAREATRLAALVTTSGIDAFRIDADELAELEPAISGGRGGGWLLPGDHRVDNRLLAEALSAGAKALGVELIEDRCLSIERSTSGIGLMLEHQGSLLAERCVLATGASVPLPGSDGLGLPAIRPIRGTTLRLSGATQPRLTRTVRAIVDGVHCYLVPRSDGSIIVGATVEEQGYAEIARVGGVADLLEAARRVFPGIEELAFDEASTGLRPATEDHLPFVGRLADPRVIAAVGHFRNGILLAPRAAEVAVELLECPA